MVNDRLAEQLFAELHEQHGPQLWRYALRLTHGDEARAQDAMQETMLRAWRHPEMLTASAEHTRRWLFRTLRTRVIDAWRARQARPEVIVDAPPEPEPVDHADTALQGMLVAEAMDRLSPAHRQALQECFYAGRSITEAAERIGVPPGTVKSRLHYGLRALRVALEESGVVVGSRHEL